MELEKLISTFFFLFSLLITGNEVVHGSSHHHQQRHQIYGFRPKMLFVFGDSYADTGNNRKTLASSWRNPYGVTFPGKPTGRYSDGRVLTDFLAKHIGIRSPIPVRWRKYGPNRLQYGMNFAYGGTGVFQTLFPDPNMTRQIDFFEKMVQDSVYTKRDLRSSLALVTLSGNDYSAYLANGGTDAGLIDFISLVVNQLTLNLKRISKLGVKKVAVAALQPLGCLPRVTMISSYKECNDTYNMAVIYHNSLLEAGVTKLNNETSGSAISILNLFQSFSNLIMNQTDDTASLKFESLLKPCCMGISSEYYCGDHDEKGVKKYTVCNNPNSTFFWDMAHPTQAGWRAVYLDLLKTNQFKS